MRCLDCGGGHVLKSTKHELLILWEDLHGVLSRELRASFLARKEIIALCAYELSTIETVMSKERLLSKVLEDLEEVQEDVNWVVADDYRKELELVHEEQEVDDELEAADIARDVIAAGEHPFIQRTDRYGFTDDMDDEDLSDTEETGFSISYIDGGDDY
jgi:hypothetical protein